jgi:hypothetical protein
MKQQKAYLRNEQYVCLLVNFTSLVILWGVLTHFINCDECRSPYATNIRVHQPIPATNNITASCLSLFVLNE